MPAITAITPAPRHPGRFTVLVDEVSFAQRMQGAPERIAERREHWRQFAKARGVAVHFMDAAT